jgi:hypothetical protein
MKDVYNSNLYTKKILEDLKKYHKKATYFNSDNILPKFIFLCGKDINIENGGNRKHVTEFYKKLRKDIICIYSEDLFNLFNIDAVDLLSFEEVLAELSDGIILFLESYGTACELGAFSMQENLMKKLLVFNDKEHIGKQTFINDGPIRKLLNRNENSVLYADLKAFLANKNSYSRLVDFIPINKKCNINVEEKKVRINSFLIELLELILILGPINKRDLIYIYKFIKDFTGYNYYSEYKNETLKNIQFKQLIELMERLQLIEQVEGNNLVIKNTQFNYRNFMFSMTNSQFNNIRAQILCRKYRYKEGIIA